MTPDLSVFHTYDAYCSKRWSQCFKPVKHDITNNNDQIWFLPSFTYCWLLYCHNSQYWSQNVFSSTRFQKYILISSSQIFKKKNSSGLVKLCQIKKMEHVVSIKNVWVQDNTLYLFYTEISSSIRKLSWREQKSSRCFGDKNGRTS